MDRKNRFTGSILGLALGDAFGAPYEGGPLERLLWFFVGRKNGKRRWTDDTQMTIDVIESLLACKRVDQDDLAQRFATSYHWSRGYGPGAAKILKRIRKGMRWQDAAKSVYRDGSFGNGGAMRAPVIGLFYSECCDDEIKKNAKAVAEITHAHPQGQEGAYLIALATAYSLQNIDSNDIIDKLIQHAESASFKEKLNVAGKWLRESQHVSSKIVAKELGNGIAALNSCVTAIYLGLEYREKSFAELLQMAIKIRGDVDSIAAMAGALWGAANSSGELPKSFLEKLEERELLMKQACSLAEINV